jgi:hypothetical protein
MAWRKNDVSWGPSSSLHEGNADNGAVPPVLSTPSNSISVERLIVPRVLLEHPSQLSQADGNGTQVLEYTCTHSSTSKGGYKYNDFHYLYPPLLGTRLFVAVTRVRE